MVEKQFQHPRREHLRLLACETSGSSHHISLQLDQSVKHATITLHIGSEATSTLPVSDPLQSSLTTSYVTGRKIDHALARSRSTYFV